MGLAVRDVTARYAVTRIRTWVVAATTRSTNHYTITASAPTGEGKTGQKHKVVWARWTRDTAQKYTGKEVCLGMLSRTVQHKTCFDCARCGAIEESLKVKVEKKELMHHEKQDRILLCFTQ